MTIHNAADYGYTTSASGPVHTRDVRIGDHFRIRCAIGITEWRVLRRHRDAGYYETVCVRWVTEPDHPSRQSRVNSIEVRSRAAIIDGKYGD